MIAVGLCDPGCGKGGGQVLHEPLWETEPALVHASTTERNWLCKCFQFDTEWGSSTLLCVRAWRLCAVLCVCCCVVRRPMHVWVWKIKRHFPMWNSRFKSRQNDTGMSHCMPSFASQLQHSLSSNGLLLFSWSPFWKSPFPKRRRNVASITSLFLIWANINTFILICTRSFAVELIGSSQPIYDNGSSPHSGAGSIKCFQNDISLMALLTRPRSSAKLNFDEW